MLEAGGGIPGSVVGSKEAAYIIVGRAAWRHEHVNELVAPRPRTEHLQWLVITRGRKDNERRPVTESSRHLEKDMSIVYGMTMIETHGTLPIFDKQPAARKNAVRKPYSIFVKSVSFPRRPIYTFRFS